MFIQTFLGSLAALVVAVVGFFLVVNPILTWRMRRAMPPMLHLHSRTRVILPISSGIEIAPRQVVQIEAKMSNDQTDFQPDRLIIGGNPSAWAILEIKIGDRVQFEQAGDVPGDAFAANVVDAFVHFDRLPPGEKICMTVRNTTGMPQGMHAVMLGSSMKKPTGSVEMTS